MNERKRAFLETFRRWDRLFRRKDGDAESDKWLIAEYFKSLGHLTPAGLDRLTEHLKETCTFFPTIKECLDATRPKDRFDYAHPFIRAAERGLIERPQQLRSIAGITRQAIADQRGEG